MVTKEKAIQVAGSLSGGVSIMGSSFNVCHAVCTGAVSLLTMVGIGITGMPFAFLQEYAIYFWSLALLLFFVSAYFYLKHRMISTELLLFNIGAIIASTPFTEIHQYIVVFWTIGGLFVIVALGLFIKNKLSGKGTTNKKAPCCEE